MCSYSRRVRTKDGHHSQNQIYSEVRCAGRNAVDIMQRNAGRANRWMQSNAVMWILAWRNVLHYLRLSWCGGMKCTVLLCGVLQHDSVRRNPVWCG